MVVNIFFRVEVILPLDIGHEALSAVTLEWLHYIKAQTIHIKLASRTPSALRRHRPTTDPAAKHLFRAAMALSACSLLFWLLLLLALHLGFLPGANNRE